MAMVVAPADANITRATHNRHIAVAVVNDRWSVNFSFTSGLEGSPFDDYATFVNPVYHRRDPAPPRVSGDVHARVANL